MNMRHIAFFVAAIITFPCVMAMSMNDIMLSYQVENLNQELASLNFTDSEMEDIKQCETLNSSDLKSIIGNRITEANKIENSKELKAYFDDLQKNDKILFHEISSLASKFIVNYQICLDQPDKSGTSCNNLLKAFALLTGKDFTEEFGLQILDLISRSDQLETNNE